MRRNQKLTSNSPLEPYIELIKDLRAQGCSHVAIAYALEEMGIQTSERSVRRALERHGNASERPQEAPRAIANTSEDDSLKQHLAATQASLKEYQEAYKRLQERASFEDRIQTIVESAIDRYDFTSRPMKFYASTKGGKAKPHQFMSLMSDAHYGERVNPEEALGLNYDTTICVRRIEHIRDTVLRYAALRRESYEIEKLVIPVLGDMLGGVIHEELATTNETSMSDQCVEMAHILFNLLQDYSQEFPEVEMFIMPGNHPRLNKKPNHKRKFDNWEYVMGKMVEGMVSVSRLPNVKVSVPRSLVHVHDVYSYRVGFYHGDSVKSNSFAGIPFYGLRNHRDGLQSLLSSLGLQRIDMLCMGHWHQHVYWKGECSVLINGAIKGGDEYGIATRLSAPDPVQVLLEWHPDHGLTAQEHITLTHIK